MNLTDIIGKKVYSIYEGEIVGTILQASFDRQFTKIHSFRIFDEEENEFDILMSNIKALGDCVIITNKNKLNTPTIKNIKNPLNMDVINENATHLGKINEVELDRFGGVSNIFTTLNYNLNPNFVYFRKQFVLFSESKINITNYRPRSEKFDLQNIKVNILNIEQAKLNPSFIPSKIQFNPGSMVGKIAKSDLLGLNNEIIVKANQVITEKIIDDAGKHNRLNQLYYIAN